jgi:hypothetical protein
MASVQDAKKDFLADRGYTSDIDDAYRQYLLATLVRTQGQINDLEMAVFATYGYTGSVADRWKQYLNALGYSGNTPDMLADYWTSNDLFPKVYIPNRFSAIPTFGTVTGSFTRASVKNVPDFEGRQYQALSGERCFWHVNRHHNLVTTTSEDFTNAAWVKLNLVVAAPTVNPVPVSPPPGFTGNAYAVTFPAVGAIGTGAKYSVIGSPVFTCSTTQKNVNAIYIRNPSGASTLFMYFFVSGAVTFCQKTLNVTTEWQRIEGPAELANAAGSARLYIGCDNNPTAMNGGSAAQTVEIFGAQIEDVTGKSVQTAGPYTSVGITAAPYFHGSMVDGVKCFGTDYNGAALPTSEAATYPMRGGYDETAATNVCTYSNTLTSWTAVGTPAATQNAVGPNGQANYAWTLTDNAAGAIEGVTAVAFTLSAVPWVASVLVAKTTGAQAAYPVLFFNPNIGTTNLVCCTVDTTNGVATEWTAYTGFTVAPTGAVYCVSYNDDFWEVGLSQTATVAAYVFSLYPAGTTNATQSTGAIDVAAQGSAAFCDAQVELGTKRSSTINTPAAATVTRPGDVMTYTGADISPAKAMACTFWRPSGVSSANYIAMLSNGTVGTYAGLYFASATGAGFAGAVGAAPQWGQLASNAYTPGTQSKAAFSMATNDIKMDKDGTAQTADTSATVPTISQLDIGNLAGTLQLNGAEADIYLWHRTLSQSELAAVDR